MSLATNSFPACNSARQYRRILLILFWVCATSGFGMAPNYISDSELSEYPIIVIARWEKVPFTTHHRTRDEQGRGNVITAIEAYTKLKVLEVIKGDVQPGEHELKNGYGISWQKDGSYVNSGTSSEMAGDVKSAAEPNLWFLRREKSWDQSRTNEYLSVSNYREIQPLKLKEYFALLGSGKFTDQVPRLLRSADEETVRRTLRVLIGGRITWPYDDGEFWILRDYVPQNPAPEITTHNQEVSELVDQSNSRRVRVDAMTTYAHLEKSNSITALRKWTGDADSSIRGMAVALLLHQKDEASVSSICKAARGIEDPWLACVVIEAIEKWADSRLVPALIEQLGNGENAGFIGDDLKTPALKAKTALHDLTGFWFPFDVEASRQAWTQVAGVADLNERNRELGRLLPKNPFPIRAELIGDGCTNAAFRVANVSQEEVTITRLPAWGNLNWPSGSGGCGPSLYQATNQSDFLRLKPNESLELKTTLSHSFLLAEPGTRRISLVYKDNGAKFGLNGWIGSVPVQAGSHWKESRVKLEMEETWPNGNLKSKGQTVNSERIGEWHFFNEAGDRIQIINYTGGGGNATCNPEHPNNKGAGRRTPDPKPVTK